MTERKPPKRIWADMEPDEGRYEWYDTPVDDPKAPEYIRADLVPRWNHDMEAAPRDGTRIMLDTPAGVTIGYWEDEQCLSDCCRAFSYPGWQGDAFGETRPGTNMGDEEEAKQQCPPTAWMPLPPVEGE